jgi:hypothetical protein
VVFRKTAAEVSSHDDSMPKIIISLFIFCIIFLSKISGVLFASSANYDYFCKLLYNL